MAKRFIDETGNKYCRLTVLEHVGRNKNNAAIFLCKCLCGNEIITTGANLRNGTTRSCGCLQKEIAKKNVIAFNNSDRYIAPSHLKHGMHDSRIYKTWCLIKQRCYNKNRDHAERYIGRGIDMCDEWRESFDSFCKWALSNGYSDDLFIDRIDNDSGYYPDNCRWATRSQQMRNREVTLYYEHNGERKPFIEWCEQFGVAYKTAWQRYRKGYGFYKIFGLQEKQECLTN